MRPGRACLTEESLAAARDSRDRHTLAQVLFLLAWAAGNTGAPDRAEAIATEALGLFRALGETGEHAEVLFVLGTSGSTRATTSGRRACSPSLAERRERGDEKATARGLSGLGTALLNLGELAAAREMLEESLVLARRYDDHWGTAMSLILLGHPRLADGDHARAQAQLADAARLFADTGNLMYLQWCLEGLAGAAAATSELRARRGARRGTRRPACPDRRAAAAGLSGRVRADAGVGSGPARRERLHRGARQAGGPTAAGADRRSHEGGGGR